MKLTLLLFVFAYIIVAAMGASTAFEECRSKCPVTLDLSEVCASDNTTYDNLRQLECDKKCGKDITLVRAGKC